MKTDFFFLLILKSTTFLSNNFLFLKKIINYKLEGLNEGVNLKKDYSEEVL